ncbi:MAG: AMP-binding protein [Bacteroidales bacterium]|nr:AMP-binding protein [Bacteroidales bacterium]
MFTTSVIAPFLKKVRLQPNETCLEIGDHKYTNAAFIQYIAPIMNELDTLTGDTVMLLMEEDVQSYAALFACMLSGKIVVPISTAWTAAQVEQVSQTVQSGVLLSHERMQYYFRMTVDDAVCRIDNGLYHFNDEQPMVRCITFNKNEEFQEQVFTTSDIMKITPPHPVHLFRFFTDMIS